MRDLVTNGTSNRYIIKKVKDLGILEKYTGFQFLILIVDMIINVKVEIKSFSRDVYPVIAEMYGKSEWTIERNIRNLINQIWIKGPSEKLFALWGKEEKPSCCKFIYLIKNYIVMQIT